jgi:hypothetical protein
MFKKLALAGVLGLVLSPAVSFAQIHITVAPPAPVVEVRGNRPGPTTSGSTAITGGKATTTCGRQATGIVRPIRMRFG